ncbi:MAG TPA: sigma-70 family RNA polymerase sigma factor [Candidatus Binatia bacterium]|nr:sigma-70 family RNA polymerase sigma factor [Candidatus Binatia bacterium]
MRKVRKVQRRAHKSPRKVPLVRSRGGLRRRSRPDRGLGKRNVFAEAEAAEVKAEKPKIIVPREVETPPVTPEPEVEETDQEPNTEELQVVAEETENTEAPVETPLKPEQLPRERTNAYSLYLREIGQTKLLTPEQEIKLAARIKRGDSRAREEMIKANLRLVVKIAREYEDYGVPLLDLINEGNIGLMKAVERFDPAKGAKLSTYAAWWIKQAIRRALSNQSKTIRLPVHVGDKLVHMRRAAVRLHEELGREPTDEELAKALETTATRINELRNAGARPSSLDAPIGGDDDSNPFGDIIGDEKADTPYEQLEDKTNTALVRELVEKLPEREATILRYRFGLDGDDERTLEEVGAKFGVTRERIRQLQNIALTKLKKMIQKREAVKMAA